MKTDSFTTQPVKKLFFHYLLPSICGTMVTSIYVLADTIIIGKGISIDAMAALNIVLPLFNIFFGTGLLFGVGGSVLMSIARGRGRDRNRTSLFFHGFPIKCRHLPHLYARVPSIFGRYRPFPRRNGRHHALCNGLCSIYSMGTWILLLFLIFTNFRSE